MTQELHIARNLYAGATRRAARAWALLNELASMRIWLDEHETLKTAASAIFYNAGYDACENYSSVEEFAESLHEDLKSLFAVEAVEGHSAFVVQPFFSKHSTMLRHMGLCSVSAASVDEFAGLNVSPLPPMETAPVNGLTAYELSMLCQGYRREAVKLVNLMRKLRTGLYYPERALAPGGRARETWDAAVKKDDALPVLTALSTAVSLSFEPSPCEFYGTEADRKNVLKTLDHEEGIAELLAS
jgi:hypothetical protein